jgi:hypothetical protein
VACHSNGPGILDETTASTSPASQYSPSLLHLLGALETDRFLCTALGHHHLSKKKTSRGGTGVRVCAPTPLHRPHENARRRQARGSGGRRAGGGDASLLRGPQGGGGGLGLGVAAGGGLQDPAQERRHEGGDAAGGRRHCPRRKSRVSTLLDSDYFSLRPAALLSPYCRAPFGVFFPLGDFFSGCRRSRSTPWRRTSPSTSRWSSTRTTARPGTASSAATLVMLSSHFLETLLCTEAGGVTIVLIVVGL